MARVNLFKRRTEMHLPMIDTKDFSDTVPTGQFFCTPRRLSSSTPLQRAGTPLAGQRSSRSASLASTTPSSGGSRSPCSSGSRSPGGSRSPLGSRSSSHTTPTSSRMASKSHIAAAAAAAVAMVAPATMPDTPSRSGSKASSGAATVTAAAILQQRRPAERPLSRAGEAGDASARKHSKGNSALLQEINAELQEADKWERGDASQKRAGHLSKMELDDMFNSMFNKQEFSQEKKAACLPHREDWQNKKRDDMVARIAKKTFAEMVLDGTINMDGEVKDDEVDSPGSAKIGSSGSDQEMNGVSGANVANASAGSQKMASTMGRVRAKLMALRTLNIMPGELKPNQEASHQEMLIQSATASH